MKGLIHDHLEMIHREKRNGRKELMLPPVLLFPVIKIHGANLFPFLLCIKNWL